MRKLTRILIMMAAAMTLTACQSKGIASATTQQTTTQQADEEMTTPREATMEENMIEKSLISLGNTYRMKKVIEKARAGEEVTVGFIGGSITEGYNAGTTEIYAKRTYDYFAKTYGTGNNVKYVNAGLSGTPSILGMIRSDKDLFDYHPDIVFIEFAVNDSTSQLHKTGFENLIMKALTQPNEPAVVLLFSVIESGYTCQDTMGLVAFQYNLPRISVKNAIWPYIESGDYKWKDWSNDGSHPNAAGSELYSKFIINYFEQLDKADADTSYNVPDSFSQKLNIQNLKQVDNTTNSDLIEIVDLGSFKAGSTNGHFGDGWSRNTDGNAPLKFTFNGDALYLVFMDTNSDSFGTAEVYIDGEKVASLIANSSDGWYNPETERVFKADANGPHTVEIKMAEDCADKQFEVLCVGVNAR